MTRMKRLFPFLLLCLALSAQILVTSLPDITGDGAAHPLASSGVARWVQFVAPSTNSTTVRVGDSSISLTEGTPIAAGAGFMLPPTTQAAGYDLTKVYYLAAVGDKLTVTYGR